MPHERDPLPGGAGGDVAPTIERVAPRPVPEGPEGPGPEPNGCGNAAGSPWRVLLVDDRSERRSIVRMVVGTDPPEGWTSVEVTEASDAAGAVAAANRQGLDAAIVEIQMAGGAGLETVEALRAAHPEVVVVVCSFRAEREMQARSLRAGADAYLTKPVSRRDLLSACRSPHRPPAPALLGPSP